MTRTLVPLIALLAGLTACADDALTADGLGLLDVEVGLTTSQGLRTSGIQAVDASGAALTVNGGRLVLERIDFELPVGQACDPAALDAPVSCEPAADLSVEGDTVRIAGPIEVDLATGRSTPALRDLTVPAGRYESVRLRLEPDLSADGTSISAFGTFADGQPWSMGLAIDEDARFEAIGGLEVTDATTATVLLDVAVWFAELPVSDCREDGLLATDGAGALRLDDTAGCELEDGLEDAIGESGRVEDDTPDSPEVETEHGPEHD